MEYVSIPKSLSFYLERQLCFQILCLEIVDSRCRHDGIAGCLSDSDSKVWSAVTKELSELRSSLVLLKDLNRGAK